LKGIVNTTVWSCSDALQKDSDSITVDLQDIRQYDDKLYELFRRDPAVAVPLVSSNSPNLRLPNWALDLRNTLWWLQLEAAVLKFLNPRAKKDEEMQNQREVFLVATEQFGPATIQAIQV
jgi:hypothetical protein